MSNITVEFIQMELLVLGISGLVGGIGAYYKIKHQIANNARESKSNTEKVEKHLEKSEDFILKLTGLEKTVESLVRDRNKFVDEVTKLASAINRLKERITYLEATNKKGS